jgi:lipoprotein-anchoring transpeptidase ErfK/SrfK
MKKVIVSVTEQNLTAYDGALIVYDFDCVSGDDDHPTTKGKWKTYRKHKVYRSKKYNAQMNYAMFFNGGEAIHQYHGFGSISLLKTLKKNVTGWIGSHGCVRLSENDAATLFQWALMGTTVEIK